MSKTNENANDQQPLDRLSLSELMGRLDQIVDWFNSGEVDIDQAAAKFDEGVKLVEVIKAKLAETDTKINQIKLKLEKVVEQ